MDAQTMNDWRLTELNTYSQINIEGGGFIGDLGYACGYAFGAATNAASILGNAIKDGLIGKAIDGAFK